MDKKNKKPKILFVARDDGGCGYFRCQQPATFLNRSGIMEAEHVLNDPTEEQIKNADLVIMQDSGSIKASNLMKYLRDNKIPYMTEFDDFVQHVSPHNLGGYPAWNPSTLYTHRAMESAKLGVGMTVSTNQLAREYFPYNPNIFVIPNYLNKEKWDNPIVKRSDGKIRIGWCGGNAHADDLHMISKVLDKIIKEYDGKVIFETMGMTRKEFAWVFPMAPTSNEDVCPSCGFEGSLHHFPGERLDDYPTVLSSKGWDIAVAPVINNSFGNCKSDLKIKEYSAAGIPIVASNVIPYKDAKDDGADIFLAETFDDWYNYIKLLIEDKERRNEMIKNNQSWVSKYWIQDNVEKIASVYKQILIAVGLLKH